MPILPSLVRTLNVVLVKIQQAVYRNAQTDSEIYIEIQRTQNRQNIPEKEQQSWKTYTR